MTTSSARRPSSSGRIRIGIGSWTDAEYTGVIFPKGVKPDERLKLLATRFDHVEVNASYHAFQPRDRVAKWAAQTPADFVFDFKLHKDFSRDPAGSGGDERLVGRMLESARPLIEAKKLGAFFLVLPPSFGPARHRLEELDALVEKLRPQPLAVELRHSGWVEGDARERTLAYFRAQNLVWIAVDMPQIAGSTIMPPVDEVTNPRLAYLRLHGRRKEWQELKTAEEKHAYPYPETELEEIAGRIRTLAAKADDVHVVANNHASDFAPKTALALQSLLGIGRGGGASDAENLLPGFE